MERSEKHGYTPLDDKVLTYCQVNTIINFEDRYLRKVSVEHNDYLKPELDALRNHEGPDSEMYKYTAKLFTKASLLLCEDESNDAKCLAAFICPMEMPKRGFEGSAIRPDIIMQWTTKEKAKEIISSADGKLKDVPLHWYNAESIIEYKKNIGTDLPSVQAMSCVHVLPCVLPNLSGMLYVTLGASDIFLFWSDPSGVLHSQNYPLHEDNQHPNKWSIESIILRYVATVMNPLPKLSSRDPTMNMRIADGKPIWDISHAGQSYDGCRQIFGFYGHSRQTCVFMDGKEERVIKDYWRNSKRGHNEGNILEKIKGVPGVVQVGVSGDVKLDEDNILKTSKISSGKNPEIMDQLKEDTRPDRVKHRSVLLSVGEPLEKRESVQEFFEAVHDSIEGHQLCFNEKKTLHCDISRENILIRPRHHSSAKFDHFVTGFICQLLNQDTKKIKEKGMLIDWENAVDLTSRDASSQLTNRVGTPTFVAESVSCGEIKLQKFPQFRYDLPKMKPATKEWYIKTYGQEHYDRYWGAMEKDESEYRKYDPEKYHYSHRAFHDAESFAWVIINELLKAWPEGFEEKLTRHSCNYINALDEHEFGCDYDSRLVFRGVYSPKGWENLMHPRLACLSPMVYKLANYFSVEWLLWPELPEDHGHEFVKVLLREAILDMQGNNDPIPLKQELRSPAKYEAAQRAHYISLMGDAYKREHSGEEKESTCKKAKAGDGED